MTRVVGRLIVVTLPLYFAWEILQAPAFTGMPEGWLAATPTCAQATLGDAMIVLALFAVGALPSFAMRAGSCRRALDATASWSWPRS